MEFNSPHWHPRIIGRALRTSTWAVLLWTLPLARATAQDLELQPGTFFRLATLNEAQQVLGASDAYTRAMTVEDRARQMRTSRATLEQEFLDFSAAQAQAWTLAEQLRLTTVVEQVRAQVAALGLPLPGRILIIKTSGQELFRSAYVRAGHIILPASYMTGLIAMQRSILVHELFHVLSSQRPDLRPALYAALGYFDVGDVEIPEPLRSTLMINPDYFERRYAFTVTTQGGTRTALPVLYSDIPRYDGSQDFFHYARFFYLQLHHTQGRWVAALDGEGAPIPLPFEMQSEFLANMGYPDYRVFQPEETLADLFAKVVLNESLVTTPRLASLLRSTLARPGKFPPGPPGGVFEREIEVPFASQSYWVEESTDLLSWRAIDKEQAVDQRLLFEDRAAWLSARKFYRARASADSMFIPGDTNNMVWIPPGSFQMGSLPSEPGYMDSDGPLTHVTLTRGFWMGKHEVTIGEYRQVTGKSPFPTQDPNMPAFPVTWSTATAYCRTLTSRSRLQGLIGTNQEYRLPTEAEWEYACRAGASTPYYWGADSARGYLHEWQMDSSGMRPHAVGLKLPNAWGLHDMLGNVAEICQDRWRARLPGGAAVDPKANSTGTGYVLRGGEYLTPTHQRRTGTRRSAAGDEGHAFRIVLAPSP
jgi:formylglycine-generating enzyme required for sulfatase activity